MPLIIFSQSAIYQYWFSNMNGINSGKDLFIPPLSVQKEADEYVIGSVELGEFYQFPEIAVTVIQLLREQLDFAEIAQKVQASSGEEVDIEDFVELLLSLNLAYPADEEYRYHEQVNDQTVPAREIKISISQTAAQLLTSWPFRIVYAAVVLYAFYLMGSNSDYAVNPTALLFYNNFTITLVSLLLLYVVTTALHEAGHMISAARLGINSTLSVSNRLWNIVLEADISGIVSLPKHKRYLPLLGGMLVDIFNISLLTILIKFLIEAQVNPYLIQLCQALILQLIITIIWQFNLFLRTDIYYLLSTISSYPNLDMEARIYIKQWLTQLKNSVKLTTSESQNNEPYDFHNLRFLQYFTAIWIIGRSLSVVFLVAVIIPTLYGYFQSAFSATETGKSSFLDLILFAVISAGLLGAGFYMWFKQKHMPTS